MKLGKFSFTKKEAKKEEVLANIQNQKKAQQIQKDYNDVCSLYFSVMSRIDQFEEDMREYAGPQMVFAGKAKKFLDDIAWLTEVHNESE